MVKIHESARMLYFPTGRGVDKEGFVGKEILESSWKKGFGEVWCEAFYGERRGSGKEGR